ncbi:MAG: hypothetical protein QW194_04175 [Candidatus Micrarchaeaceae archaeon]
MVEKNGILEDRPSRLSNSSLKATRLSEPHIAGLVPAMRYVAHKCASAALLSDSDIASMLEEVMRIYDSYFAHINVQESVGMLEAVGVALSAGGRYAVSANPANQDAASIAERIRVFDNMFKTASGRPMPSTYMFEMLATACRYAKGGTFKIMGLSIYDPMKKDQSVPVLGALRKPQAGDSTAFMLSREDAAAVARLSRALPQSSEYSWVYAADVISNAASFINDFLLNRSAPASVLLDSAIEYMSRNANALRRENTGGIEKMALSLFVSRASAAHLLGGDEVTAGIGLGKKVDEYKGNLMGLRIFSSALGIIVSQLSAEKVSVEASKNGVLYLKGNRQLQMEYFTNRLATMRKKLGSEFEDVEGIAMACLDIVVKSEGFGSNSALMKKLDTLRKALYFGWIASVGDDTKTEMDDQTAAIMEMLKASKKLGQSAFSLFVDSVSLIYGLGVHMEKVGSLVSLTRNK